MKSVLFCKIEAPTFSSVGMVKGFKEAGFEEVFEFDWQRFRFDVGLEGMRSRLLGMAVMNQPDLIFLHLQVNSALDIETAQALQTIAPVVNFTEDVREDTGWYEDVAPHISLTIFTNKEDVEKLKQKGIDNVVYMPTSYNDVWYQKYPVKPEKKYGDIVFLGQNYVGTNLNFPLAEERQRMIQFLKAEYGDLFQAYGMGQENQMLNPMEAVNAYNNCKIAIGHNNFLRVGYSSDRLYNAMGCGAFFISSYFPDIETLFDKEKNLEWYQNLDELKNLIDYYLDDDTEREAIAKQGYRVVSENHTWKNRIFCLIVMLYTKNYNNNGLYFAGGYKTIPVHEHIDNIIKVFKNK